VAKKVNIFAVKVLNATGYGDTSQVLQGIEYVVSQVRPGKTIMSMSIGGEQEKPIDDAVNAAVAAGVVTIVAAGNESDDACKYSPAGASDVLTVGATTRTDTMAFYSNTGKCVEILAPGSSITSLWRGKDGATSTISGTSMATPHVSGVAALLMSDKVYTKPQEVYADLTSLATKGKITGLGADTVNLLLFNGVA
jgi:subtilisin family serine protease